MDLTCQLLLHAAAPFVEDEGLFNAITSSSHPGTTLGTSVPGSGLERSVSGGPSRDKLIMLEKLSTETQNFQVSHNFLQKLELNSVHVLSFLLYLQGRSTDTEKWFHAITT